MPDRRGRLRRHRRRRVDHRRTTSSAPTRPAAPDPAPSTSAWRSKASRASSWAAPILPTATSISGNDQAQVYIGDSGGPDTIVKGNLIGTNAAGTRSIPGFADYAQIYVRLGLGVIIGGPTAAERNVISGSIGSGNPGAGVGVGYTIGGTTAQATIQGNFIGTDVTGTLPIPNGNGLVIPDSNCVVKGNVISGNTLQAILGEGGGNELIQGNFIGTDETATLDLGNGGGAVTVGGDDWTVGGIAPGEGNVIAFNPNGGVANSGYQHSHHPGQPDVRQHAARHRSLPDMA